MENSPLYSKNKQVSDKYKDALSNSLNKAIASQKFFPEDIETQSYLEARIDRVRSMGKYFIRYTISVSMLKIFVLSKWLGKGFSLPSVGYYFFCILAGPPVVGKLIFTSDFNAETMKIAIKNEKNLFEVDENLKKLYLNYMKEDISDQFKPETSEKKTN